MPERTTGAFMDTLERLGVRFTLDAAGRVVLDSPPGVLTPELRAELTARRAAIAHLVRLALIPANPDAPAQLALDGPGGRAA